MPVACDVCGYLNRDNAMFCLGCARRLMDFMPTQPCALFDTAVGQGGDAPDHSGAAAQAAITAGAAAPPTDSSGLWVRLGLVMLAMSLAFMAWYAYITHRSAQAPPPGREAVAAAPAVAAPSPAPMAVPEPPKAPAKTEPPVFDPPAAPLQPVEPVQVTPSKPVEPVRSADRAERAPGPPAAAGPAPQARSSAPPAPRPAPRTRVDANARNETNHRDPVSACADLDYLAMGRCRRAQCQTAESRWHPNCQAIRAEQQQASESQRRLSQGY